MIHHRDRDSWNLSALASMNTQNGTLNKAFLEFGHALAE